MFNFHLSEVQTRISTCTSMYVSTSNNNPNDTCQEAVAPVDMLDMLLSWPLTNRIGKWCQPMQIPLKMSARTMSSIWIRF